MGTPSQCSRSVLVPAVIILGMILASCAAAVQTSIYDRSLATRPPGCDLVVVPPTESIVGRGRVIGEMKVGDSGFSVNCDFDNAMRLLRRKACAVGADGVHLWLVFEPSIVSTCYRVHARFFVNKENPSSFLSDSVRSSRELQGTFGGASCGFPSRKACEWDRQCDGYTCNRVTGFCEDSCIGRGASPYCDVGYICHKRRCIRPGTCGSCSSDFACSPFQCDSYSAECKSSCYTSADCVVGAGCQAGKCVR